MADVTHVKVAAHHGCHPSTVGRLLKKLEACATTATLKRPVRPSQFTPHHLSHFELIVIADRWQTLHQLAATLSDYNLPISVSHLRRKLKGLGLQRGIARIKPLLTKEARQAQLAYAKAHRKDELDAWRSTTFTDESKAKSVRLVNFSPRGLFLSCETHIVTSHPHFSLCPRFLSTSQSRYSRDSNKQVVLGLRLQSSFSGGDLSTVARSVSLGAP